MVAQQIVSWRKQFAFDFVLMLGDNIYDSHTPEDYVLKFEEPYKALLDAGVTFRAAIGNHDEPSSVNYDKFNMGGRRYYTFRRSEMSVEGGIAGAGVRFYALDSRTLDVEQLDWLRAELKDSGSRWNIVFCHHPIYTTPTSCLRVTSTSTNASCLSVEFSTSFRGRRALCAPAISGGRS
jgi:phosphodiesterase/alkaline phosphatase D-like protein